MAEAGGPRAVAVNVGANTNEPGFRGPVYADGSVGSHPRAGADGRSGPDLR